MSGTQTLDAAYTWTTPPQPGSVGVLQWTNRRDGRRLMTLVPLSDADPRPGWLGFVDGGQSWVGGIVRVIDERTVEQLTDDDAAAAIAAASPYPDLWSDTDARAVLDHLRPGAARDRAADLIRACRSRGLLLSRWQANKSRYRTTITYTVHRGDRAAQARHQRDIIATGNLSNPEAAGARGAAYVLFTDLLTEVSRG